MFNANTGEKLTQSLTGRSEDHYPGAVQDVLLFEAYS